MKRKHLLAVLIVWAALFSALPGCKDSSPQPSPGSISD